MSEANEPGVPASDTARSEMVVFQPLELQVQTAAVPPPFEGEAPTYWEVPADGVADAWKNWPKVKVDMDAKAREAVKHAVKTPALTLQHKAEQTSGGDDDDAISNKRRISTAVEHCYCKGYLDPARPDLKPVGKLRFPDGGYVYPPAPGGMIAFPITVFGDDGVPIVLKNTSFFAHRVQGISGSAENAGDVKTTKDIIGRVVMAARQAEEASIFDLVMRDAVAKFVTEVVLRSTSGGDDGGASMNSTAPASEEASASYQSLPWQALMPMQRGTKDRRSPMHPALANTTVVMPTKHKPVSFFLFPYGQLY
jgi:hypothetical protein